MVYLSTYKTGRKGDLSTLPALTKQPNTEAVMADSKVRNSTVEGKEVWKDIEGYEGYYQVSSLGRVRSLKRKVVKSNGVVFPVRSCIMEGSIFNTGYRCVGLRKDDYCENLLVHRLVAQAFVPNPENKPEVNHIDGIKTHNHPSNLEWVTGKEQSIHAWETGLINNHGSNNGRSKLNENQVIEIRERYKKESISHRELAEEYDISRTQITNILNNKIWRHV